MQRSGLICLAGSVLYGGSATWPCRKPNLYEASQLRILHLAEEDNLSPYDSKIACLCQSIEINNNKHIHTITWVAPWSNGNARGQVTVGQRKKVTAVTFFRCPTVRWLSSVTSTTGIPPTCYQFHLLSQWVSIPVEPHLLEKGSETKYFISLLKWNQTE